MARKALGLLQPMTTISISSINDLFQRPAQKPREGV